MTTTTAWGETLEVQMQLGFPVNKFTIGNTTSGVIGDPNYFIGGTLDGIDVSPYVLSLSTSRGRPDQLAQFTAGSATIQLNNRDRRFDPINESSPYWNTIEGRTGVVPRRKVTIKCDGDPVFVGRITDIDISYEPTRLTATTENSSVTITAADDFLLLANTFTASPITPSEQFSGARVSAILDLPEVDYPSTSRDIDTGVAVLGGGATFAIDANTNVLTYLQEITKSEEGLLFVDRTGWLTFRDRVLPSFDNPVLTFADNGSGIDYQSISIIYGSEFLYNRVTCSIVGGTDQVVDDLTSQEEFGIITLSLSDLLLKDDAAALELANVLLDRYSQPQYRFDAVQVIYNNKTALQREGLTQLEVGEQIEVTRTFRTGTPASVTEGYVVEGVRHTISPQSHSVVYSLSATDVLYPFIIGDPVYGVIGTVNAIS
jgi:hypothetical protein